MGFAAATLAAYVLTRTVGLLGFEDNQLTGEAVVAFVAEVIALGALGSWLTRASRIARPVRASVGPGGVEPPSDGS